MRLLIKIGGSLLDEQDSRSRIAGQIASIAHEHEAVVVHGGGKQLTRFLEAQGVDSAFVNGMRISDATVIDGIAKVIAGSVNKTLVAAIIAAGESAIGLSGVDGLLTSAVQLAPEMHFVGRPVKTDSRLLDMLVNAGYLPVIACIAGDSQGAIYNVNADQMAVSCATAWRADKLLFLTDVPGVKNEAGEIAAALNLRQVRALIESEVADGGMQAKLEAAVSALLSGVEEVIIAPGNEANVCQRLLAGEAIGTRVCLAGEKVADA